MVIDKKNASLLIYKFQQILANFIHTFWKKVYKKVSVIS